MRLFIRKISVLVLSVILLYSCDKESDFVYPDLYTEFACLCTNSEGTVDCIVTDNGKSWGVPPVDGLTKLVPDTTYRVVARFVPDTPTENMAKIYASQGAISPLPVNLNKIGSLKSDPVKIQSITRNGGYVNIVLNVLSKEKNHKYHFIEESITRISKGDNQKTRLSIILYHDKNDDVNAFYRTIYLSIPLWPYKDILTEGDEIEVNINTYDKGWVTTCLNY